MASNRSTSFSDSPGSPKFRAKLWASQARSEPQGHPSLHLAPVQFWSLALAGSELHGSASTATLDLLLCVSGPQLPISFFLPQHPSWNTKPTLHLVHSQGSYLMLQNLIPKGGDTHGRWDTGHRLVFWRALLCLIKYVVSPLQPMHDKLVTSVIVQLWVSHVSNQILYF